MPLLMVVPFLSLTKVIFDVEQNDELYLLIGCVAGVVAGTITTLGVILCLRRHRKHKTGEIIVVNKTKVLEGQSHIAPSQDNHNTYVKDTESAMPAGSACPQRNDSHTSQQKKVSISSDYTESHYYTEIDEYFINKRIAKKQKKNCYEKKSFEEDTPTPEHKINIEANVYDYAYGMRPQK